MFRCERCGTGYDGDYVGVESCPRCLLLDRVQSPLTFKMFRISGEAGAAAELPPAAELQPPEAQPGQRVRSAR